MSKKELKNEKFVRLANSRMNTVIGKLDLIGNLANQQFYNCSDNQVEKIIDRLEVEIRILESKFARRHCDLIDKDKFTLEKP